MPAGHFTSTTVFTTAIDFLANRLYCEISEHLLCSMNVDELYLAVQISSRSWPVE